MELRALTAWYVADLPNPEPVPEVRDRAPGDRDRRGMVCNNELRPEYGRVQENGNEYPGADERLREMGE